MIGNNLKNNLSVNNNTFVAQGNDVIGVPIFDTGAVSLGATPINPTIPNEIISYNGLGISALHGDLTIVDTPSATAPVGVSDLESVIKKFSLQSINSQVGAPLVDFDGSISEISNWTRIINPNGNAQISPTPTIATSQVTTTWHFDIYYDIPRELLGVRPTLQFNTEGSRATTLNSMTSTAQLVLTADYTSLNVSGQPLKRSRLKNIQIPNSSTGVFQFANSLDKNVSVIQQAYDVGADSNLSLTNTINFALGGQQIINNMKYTNITGAEASLYPLGSHISGFFPYRVIDKNTRYFDSSLNDSLNIASAPTIGKGVNQIANKMNAYLQEVV